MSTHSIPHQEEFFNALEDFGIQPSLNYEKGVLVTKWLDQEIHYGISDLATGPIKNGDRGVQGVTRQVRLDLMTKALESAQLVVDTSNREIKVSVLREFKDFQLIGSYMTFYSAYELLRQEYEFESEEIIVKLGEVNTFLLYSANGTHRVDIYLPPVNVEASWEAMLRTIIEDTLDALE